MIVLLAASSYLAQYSKVQKLQEENQSYDCYYSMLLSFERRPPISKGVAMGERKQQNKFRVFCLVSGIHSYIGLSAALLISELRSLPLSLISGVPSG